MSHSHTSCVWFSFTGKNKYTLSYILRYKIFVEFCRKHTVVGNSTPSHPRKPVNFRYQFCRSNVNRATIFNLVNPPGKDLLLFIFFLIFFSLSELLWNPFDSNLLLTVIRMGNLVLSTNLKTNKRVLSKIQTSSLLKIVLGSYYKIIFHT